MRIVGPIDDIVRASERDLDRSDGAVLPDQWADVAQPNEPLVVEGVIDPDGPILTFTANGHTERFVPAPPDNYVICH